MIYLQLIYNAVGFILMLPWIVTKFISFIFFTAALTILALVAGIATLEFKEVYKVFKKHLNIEYKSIIKLN